MLVTWSWGHLPTQPPAWGYSICRNTSYSWTGRRCNSIRALPACPRSSSRRSLGPMTGQADVSSGVCLVTDTALP